MSTVSLIRNSTYMLKEGNKSFLKILNFQSKIFKLGANINLFQELKEKWLASNFSSLSLPLPHPANETSPLRVCCTWAKAAEALGLSHGQGHETSPLDSQQLPWALIKPCQPGQKGNQNTLVLKAFRPQKGIKNRINMLEVQTAS